MARAWSLDLRERVIAACEAGEWTRSEARFQIGETRLYEWLQRWRDSHSLAPEPASGSRTSPLNRSLLRQLVQEHNDRTLEEYAELYAAKTGRRYGISHLSRVDESGGAH